MKLLIEILLSVFLHPIAMILAWLSVLARKDLGFLNKIIWLVVTTVWGIGPILYVLVGGGSLW
jgi:hypothetical protein